MASRFHLFTEDPALRSTVEDGLSRWNPVGRMLGGALQATGAGQRPDVLIIDLAHPLAPVLVDSVLRMARPPAVLAIADALGAAPSVPFQVVSHPVDPAVLAYSVRTALGARRSEAR